MKTFLKKSLLLAALITPGMASAQGCIEYSTDGGLILKEGSFRGPVAVVASYFAIIMERDLYNSRGTRLRDFRAIMQQDRANVHKSGVVDRILDTYADGSPNSIAEDFDSYFTTLERRTLLSSLPYYAYCFEDGANEGLARDIVAGRVNAAGLTVTLFRRPNGGLAVLLAPVG
jgi:hypothetical protein